MTGIRSKHHQQDPGWNFDNSYARLPDFFFTRIDPVPVQQPKLVILNRPLAAGLGLNPQTLENKEGTAVLAGNRLPPGAQPLAQAYAGHQFGFFTILGDGRAILLGEQVTPAGERFDIQLKGSGRTPYSRGGDGRAALGPMLREYIISEAMAALNIPTSRSLAVVASGEPVFRETPLPGAVLTRVTASHLRVGTFECVAFHNRIEDLRGLADYAIGRHFTKIDGSRNRYLEFLRHVLKRQTALIARWQLVGFVHGVMNTDNMSIAGETIDYGPCAFLNEYDPAAVFSSIDTSGRYAYDQQPAIGLWNLTRFAESLLPLFHDEPETAVQSARDVLSEYSAIYQTEFQAGLNKKLGLFAGRAGDEDLGRKLLEWMHRQHADFTLTFRTLDPEPDLELESNDTGEFRAWKRKWRSRLARQPQSLEEARLLIQAHNPARIPRNHQVEAVLAAVQDGDLDPLHKILAALAHPYQEQPEYAAFRLPPSPSPIPYRTFCGT